MKDDHQTAPESEIGICRHKALFISDVHLGTRTAQADALIAFLRDHDADVIYLVGDIIDFWRVRRRAQHVDAVLRGDGIYGQRWHLWR